jgi:hypothetical protein
VNGTAQAVLMRGAAVAIPGSRGGNDEPVEEETVRTAGKSEHGDDYGDIAGQKAENPVTFSIYYCRSFGRPEFKPGAGSFLAPTRPFKVLTATPRQAVKGARTKWCKMINPKKIDLAALLQEDDAPTNSPFASTWSVTTSHNRTTSSMLSARPSRLWKQAGFTARKSVRIAGVSPWRKAVSNV